MASLSFEHVSFGYDAAPDDLFADLQFGVSEGWAGVIGANGSGKTTILRLASGELEPRAGRVHRPPHALYCAQRTDEPMDAFGELLMADDGEAYQIRGRLGVEDDWLERWTTLSHGERKRAQIATCLWLDPDLLAIDEPTNHLDRDAHRRVIGALRSYRGIGLLVSHDRELLDGLCTHCLFVSGSIVALRSGGYTAAREGVLAEDRALRERRVKARAEERRLDRERVVRRRHQEIAEKAKSLRGMNPRDSDARQKAYAARVSDSGAGKRLRQLEGRIAQAKEAQHVGPLLRQSALGIDIVGERAPCNRLCHLPAGSIRLGDERSLRFDELMVLPADRIALVGPNGSGKSTLIRHLVDCIDLGPGRVVTIPQEIDAETSARLIDEVRDLPGERLGRTMSWVSRLGSDPERLLGSRLPSPGEVRKLLLAMHIADRPYLIILDEPTNHMDLPSIECLEEALCGAACALLLVSHDERFLGRLTTTRWVIEPDGSSASFRLVRRTLPGGGLDDCRAPA